MTAVLTGESIATMASLGERLKEVMVLRGVSASKLSLDAGLSRTAVQKIIDRGGARTSSDTISKIATAAHVDREWLESGRGTPGAAAPRELALEREPEHVPADDEVPQETALFRVYVTAPKGRYTTADFDAARAAIRGVDRKALPDGDHDEHAAQLLDAARSLRQLGVPATVQNVMARALGTKTPRVAEVQAEVDAAFNDESDEIAREHGLVPGQGAASLAAARAKKGRRGA